MFRRIETVNNYLPYIDFGRARIGGDYWVIRFLLYNISQLCTDNLYKLVIYSMAWNKEQELIVDLEKKLRRSNKSKLWNENSKGNVHGNDYL